MRGAPSVAPLPVVLRVLEGVADRTSYRLAAGVCLIGNSNAAHLLVNEPTVSRQHCEVELTQGGVMVSDLESRNGTFYLGRKVDRIVLGPGATFSVGVVQIAIEPDLDPMRIEPAATASLGRLQGSSLAMRRLYTIIGRLAGSTVSVVIEGESGSGKGAIARAIHDNSLLREGPFVVVRCSALNPETLASELFGHATTGPGAFERARGGTLVLDDADALPRELQPLLLDSIEAEETKIDGGLRARPRVLSATLGSLEEAVREGRFHQGLYFRLSSVRVIAPPLRDRREDIPMLATTFAQEFQVALPSAVVEELIARPWPGNIRELRGAVQAFAALGALPPASRVRGGMLDLALDEMVDPSGAYADQKDALIDRFTRRYLEALIRYTEGNQSVAARIAGLDRTYLGRLLAKYGIKG